MCFCFVSLRFAFRFFVCMKATKGTAANGSGASRRRSSANRHFHDGSEKGSGVQCRSAANHAKVEVSTRLGAFADREPRSGNCVGYRARTGVRPPAGAPTFDSITSHTNHYSASAAASTARTTRTTTARPRTPNSRHSIVGGSCGRCGRTAAPCGSRHRYGRRRLRQHVNGPQLTSLTRLMRKLAVFHWLVGYTSKPRLQKMVASINHVIRFATISTVYRNRNTHWHTLTQMHALTHARHARTSCAHDATTRPDR